VNIAYFAKAIFAFVVPLAVPPVVLFAFGGSAHHLAGAALLGLASAIPTAAAVYWVPNRTHGFNVNDIAAALIEAGFDAVAESEENQHDQ